MGVRFNSGWKTSATTSRPFIFSLLQLTGANYVVAKLICQVECPAKDDDRLLNMSDAGALGEVSLAIWRVEVVQGDGSEFQNPPEELQLHERSKKLTSHHVK
jgi:hypothetical protein